MEAIQKDKRYTYAEYLTWGEEIRCELIGGVIHMLAAPTWEHQSIVADLTRQFGSFLLNKPCKVFPAPFDVRLNAADGDDTVVQPDLTIVCDRSKLDGTGCIGAPDMVVEVLSPSTAGKDCLVKLNWYLNTGVRECWIVDPDSKSLRTYVMIDGECITTAYAKTDTVPVHILDGCNICFSEVFA